ncbi:metal-dependent hydrolase [Sphingopyxis sp. GW247-27LB]|uniref:metal-dependent hydrolase n=1 Tax=Sphingopyxis sp. GW247-27LB TaxID=2012632 RepID=UPI000BA7CFA5|nr:metal-dependent hydrolase [Sphingopyxis sp. GW247-27LB]PAL25576.1 metal-dependent hydrolase [Sphingopyxis sp. GW247-27LB]
MDNLTHSLVGAVLGQMGLKRKTALAMPTLIIAANLPDIDAGCAVYGIESLAMRRGITHGPIALLLLPLILWAAMIAFDRWQARRGTRPVTRPALHKGWLLALAYLGCLSHPVFDWLNNYGIRLLEPFSHRWFYGDTLFIIDPWIWIVLGLSAWLSLRRERTGAPRWTRPAWIGFIAVCAYIFANGLITGRAEAQVADLLRRQGQGDALVVASPPPLAFWRRDVFWREGGRYGSGAYALGSGSTVEPGVPTGMDDLRLRLWAKADPAARAFLFWARMPVATRDGDAIVLRDQRFMQPLARDRFMVRVRAPDTASHAE